MSPAALAAHGLACVRGDHLIFENLDFAASAGELWQITGPNGAGKTSLLRLLAGLAQPAAGTVRWRGAPLPTGRDALHADLQFLGHLPGVSGALSASENLQHARQLAAVPTALPIDAALMAMGLADKHDVPAYRLSAGQRQRLALARFLLAKATLWIMDEPFTALDDAGRRQAERLLLQHVAEGGIAVVSTHHALDIPATHLRRLELAGVAA